MLTLSQLRRRVDALKRKYAKELAVVRLRRLADQYSQQWACDISDRKPAPQSQPFIRQIAQSGYRLQDLCGPRHLPETLPRTGRYPRFLGCYLQTSSQDPFRPPARNAPVGCSGPASAAIPNLGMVLYPLAEPVPPISVCWDAGWGDLTAESLILGTSEQVPSPSTGEG